MERNRKLLALGIVELLFVLSVLMLMNVVMMELSFLPSIVWVALLWFLSGSGFTVLALSYIIKS